MKHFVMTMLAVWVALCAVAQVNRVYIDDFEIYPDSTVAVSVMLANVDETRGLQFDMYVCQGLTVDDEELTEYSEDYGMNLSFRYNNNDSCYKAIIYPANAICFPPDVQAVMRLYFKADADFKGGNIYFKKVRGSTINNVSIIIQDDTTHVTVPASSLMGIPIDNQPESDQYFNLMGQPISDADSVPVAIQVTTLPNGQRASRKVAVRH